MPIGFPIIRRPAADDTDALTQFSFDETDIVLSAEGKAGLADDGRGTAPPPTSAGSAGLHINLVAEASVANAPDWFTPGVQTAAHLLEQAFSDNITINVTYGWGTIGGSSISNPNVALGGAYLYNVGYSTFKGWLAADASSGDDASAVASLPGASSVNGRSTFRVSTAQEKALGQLAPDAAAVDGQIGFGTGWTSNAIVGAALHELTHAMGRLSGGSMDLFRFSAPGSYQFTLGQPAYFSVNGGQTNLANFGQTSDTGDWLGSGGSATPNDPFNEFINSSSNALTAVDLTVMDVLGFNRAGSSPPPPPDDYANSLTDSAHPLGAVGVNGASTGAVDVAGDRDWFAVQLAAGGTYVINLEGSPTGAGTLADAYLRLHDGTGALLAQNDDVSSGNLNSQLTFAAPTAGTYYVEAGAYNDASTGTYRVSVTGSVVPLAGPHDFNGDGRDDVLWRRDDGYVGIWEMDGFQTLAGQGVGGQANQWQVDGAGDFNGDGKSDILWRADGGTVGIWEMNGFQVLAAQGIGAAAAQWHIEGTGDFNHDGKDDILWRGDDGYVGIWEMDGLQLLAGQGVGGAAAQWHIEGTGDFNGDGKTDILWRGDDGFVGMWEMDGFQVLSGQGVAGQPNDWHVAGIGDFNGDGRSDILWRHDGGAVGIWEMNGFGILSGQGVGAASNDWHIV